MHFSSRVFALKPLYVISRPSFNHCKKLLPRTTAAVKARVADSCKDACAHSSAAGSVSPAAVFFLSRASLHSAGLFSASTGASFVGADVSAILLRYEEKQERLIPNLLQLGQEK